jgi:hypothetical protein
MLDRGALREGKGQEAMQGPHSLKVDASGIREALERVRLTHLDHPSKVLSS